MAHISSNKQILDVFLEKLGDIASVEKQAKLEGRSMSMVVTGKK